MAPDHIDFTPPPSVERPIQASVYTMGGVLAQVNSRLSGVRLEMPKIKEERGRAVYELVVNGTLRSGDRKMDITFEDFLKLRDNKEKYAIFLGMTKELGLNGEDFFNTNRNIIHHIDEYKDQIWAPSTRKILETN